MIFDEVEVGHELPVAHYEVSREDLRAYAEASGDRNPIHLDEATARSVGLPDVIAHGMLTMGLAGSVVADWAGDPRAVVSYGTKFTAPVVVPADAPAVVEVAGRVVSRDETARTVEVDLAVTHAGAKVLGRARALVRLP
ncbi:acyl dehydratase [Kineococcus radiotolerans]|uniref:MaoC domain protein dehydratase n=2 Tax=Kineococcus radiotolerans TaxID=131568 RepID=A6W5R5_KINRD|nr:MaoC family dehydratase [Kineococcus radiotolerans]ABS02154.1 MaoC domain protein dehydratase [Kineococcus radiotolerans SRS30216 = ATCC BAA-149]MBB2900677.1 acyl dehydratase [Kineococcus radiotolerans]